MEQWYAVYTKPTKEQVATDNLLRQGFRCFFPRIKQVRKKAGKNKIVLLRSFHDIFLYV